MRNNIAIVQLSFVIMKPVEHEKKYILYERLHTVRRACTSHAPRVHQRQIFDLLAGNPGKLIHSNATYNFSGHLK